MDVNRALVVYKRSLREKLQGTEHENDKPIVRAHEENQRTLETVQRVLRSFGISHDVRHRSSVKSTLSSDLVLSDGGDGTFLTAASAVLDTPILGVNSSPKHSVGFFCATDRRGFKRTLEHLLDDELQTTKIARMRVVKDDELLHDRILNDVLVTQNHPAATSRYVIRVGRTREDQRSSGIWVATPAGSTAAIRAAGGKLLGIRSKRLQFVVREPYLPPGRTYELTDGILSERQKLVVTSRMVKGRLYLDGPRNSVVFEMGSKATFDMNGHPLTVLGLDTDKREHWR